MLDGVHVTESTSRRGSTTLCSGIMGYKSAEDMHEVMYLFLKQGSD